MIVVDNTILSDDIFEEYFMCNLSACKGFCCVEGDAGAPLDEEEISVLEDSIEAIKPYMCRQGVDSIDISGVFDYDMEGHLVTPLINDSACAFVYYDAGIAKCAIEKAYMENKIKFKKPISCHLYPIRISSHLHYDALNYHRWPICKSACEYGKTQQLTIFEFLKEPLIRKYGKRWYQKVQKEAELYFENKMRMSQFIKQSGKK